MSQVALGRPLGELHLRDQLGADPVRLLVGRQQAVERRGGRPARLEQAPHVRQLLVGEAAADMPGVAQAPARRRQPQEQRPEVRARAARLGEAADHQLLALDQLQLPPVERPPPRLVGRPRVLGDDPLPALPARLVHERGAVAAHLARHPERAVDTVPEGGLQSDAPLGERQTDQIIVSVMQQIEGDEGDRPLARHPRHLGSGGLVDPLLKPLEPDRLPLCVERHDLAVEQRGRLAFLPPARERLDDLGELPGLVVPLPRGDGHLDRAAARHHRDQGPDPVVLRLVDQVRVDERRFGQGRQHRLHLPSILSRFWRAPLRGRGRGHSGSRPARPGGCPAWPTTHRRSPGRIATARRPSAPSPSPARRSPPRPRFFGPFR